MKTEQFLLGVVLLILFAGGCQCLQIEESCSMEEGSSIGAQSITMSPYNCTYFSDKGASKIWRCCNNSSYQVYAGEAGEGYHNGDLKVAKFYLPLSLVWCGHGIHEGIYIADNKCLVRFINMQGLVSLFMGSDPSCKKADKATGIKLTYVSALTCNEERDKLLIMNSGSAQSYEVKVANITNPSPAPSPAPSPTPTPTPTQPSKQISRHVSWVEDSGMEIWLPIITLVIGYFGHVLQSRCLSNGYKKLEEQQQENYLNYRTLMAMIWRLILILHKKKVIDLYIAFCRKMSTVNFHQWSKKLGFFLYIIKFTIFVFKRRYSIFHVLNLWMKYEEDQNYEENQNQHQNQDFFNAQQNKQQSQKNLIEMDGASSQDENNQNDKNLISDENFLQQEIHSSAQVQFTEEINDAMNTENLDRDQIFKQQVFQIINTELDFQKQQQQQKDQQNFEYNLSFQRSLIQQEDVASKQSEQNDPFKDLFEDQKQRITQNIDHQQNEGLKMRENFQNKY
eukprot:TRINITY_DN11765_c0_g1_i3.p1 TRINITY_DN11765_c0_g1~~TRINITY_DN11765_c0_g1_i3.p1  ORF type:complete len:535 (-),score=63.27 TRINITY_DN11765_c0_g1_i3:278-1798(-)